ncbi:MAG: phosphoenolpyruvate--protein phosphotransferase [Candidatus Zapsychrus exili]|nr:phosphoenolpyruvate--protein phosphotransferase [Candidatus Zapsychrus exili]
MKKNKRDQIKLICDVGELCGPFCDSTSLEEFLQKIVEMIAHHMKSDVCSVYLFYDDTQELILKATKGLNQDFIGNVKLKLNEGLTGLALKELRPICERNASQNSNFRYFPGLGEERYESFLVVPIVRGKNRIGAIVIQNTIKDYFSDEDIKALQAITSQLANTIEMTRFIMSLEETHESRKAVSKKKDLKFVKGKVGSSGLAFSEVMVISDEINLRSYCQKHSGAYVLEDFIKAVRATEKQLNNIQKKVEEKLSDVASLIFTAQILMLKDKNFIDLITLKIKNGIDPIESIISVVESYVKKFESIPNPYLQERSQDVRDIGKRLLGNLIGKDQNVLNYEGRIVIAEELFASDILKLFSQKVKGVILLSGGVTSHLSILSQSLKIPLIIADEPALLSLPQGIKILMDAEQGNIYVRPSKEIIATFKNKEDTTLKSTKLKKNVSSETYTCDGSRVVLMANINLLGDLKSAHDFKAEGIGLYRTEFPFIVRNDFPSEEEQYIIYKKLVAGMLGKEITFRTLDIGGDKVLSYFQLHSKEANPFLGMRSIRFSLRHKDIFSQQIRAILRAGANSKIRIMFPMIASLDEFLEAKKIVSDCIKFLKKEKIPCNEKLQIGLMIELPSVLEILDDLACHADFFSIGTNDFIQYMLAVDRTNEKVAELYLPHHPSILRALNKVVKSAKKFNKEVSICGDMVHNEKYLNFLLGIGIRTMSLNPDYIPRIQNIIMNLNLEEAQNFANSVLKENRLKGIERLMLSFNNDSK